MEIVVGGAKRDEEPVGHAAASPHRRKEIAWRDHHHRVHLESPQKMKKNENQDFYGCQHFEMSIVMQRTYFGSHRVNI